VKSSLLVTTSGRDLWRTGRAPPEPAECSQVRMEQRPADAQGARASGGARYLQSSL